MLFRSSLIFGHPDPSSLPKHPAQPRYTEPSGTSLFVPSAILSVTQHTLTEHLPALGSGVTEPVWALYPIAEDYVMPCFLPSKLPYLLPSPSSSLLSADDLASCLIGQMDWLLLEMRPDSPGEPGMQSRDPCLPWPHTPYLRALQLHPPKGQF